MRSGASSTHDAILAAQQPQPRRRRRPQARRSAAATGPGLMAGRGGETRGGRGGAEPSGAGRGRAAQPRRAPALPNRPACAAGLRAAPGGAASRSRQRGAGPERPRLGWQAPAPSLALTGPGGAASIAALLGTALMR